MIALTQCGYGKKYTIPIHGVYLVFMLFVIF